MPKNEDGKNISSSVQEIQTHIDTKNQEVNFNETKKMKNKLYFSIFLVLIVIIAGSYLFLNKSNKKSLAPLSEQKQAAPPQPTKEQLTQIVQSKSTILNNVVEEKPLVRSDLPRELSGLIDAEAQDLTVSKALLDNQPGWVIKYAVKRNLQTAYQRLNSARVQKWSKVVGVVGENSAVMEIQYPRPELGLNGKAYKVKAVLSAENSEIEMTFLEIRAVPLK